MQFTNHFSTILSPPTFKDKEKNRIARLLHLLILYFMIFATLVLSVLLTIRPAYLITRTIQISTAIGVLMVLYGLTRRGYLKTVAISLVIFIFLLLASANVTTGGVDALATTGYIVVTIMASLLINRHAGIVVAVLASTLTLIIVFVQNQPLSLVSVNMREDLYTWIMQSMFFILISGMLNLVLGSLEEAQDRLKYQVRIVQNISDAVISISPDGFISSWNNGAEALYGWQAHEVIGQPLEQFVRTEYLDGTTDETAREILTTTGAWKGEVIQHHRDGHSLYIDSSVSVIRNETGSIIALAAINQDISTTKALDEQREYANELESRLEKERELISRRERYTSMISHEFRTPLTIIKSSADFTQKYFERIKPEKVNEHQNRIIQQVDRLVTLLDDLLAFNRAEAEKLDFTATEINIAEFCNDLITPWQQLHNDNHTLILNIGSVPETIQANEDMLDHIFNNLISNAIKYSPPESIIQFDVRQKDGTVCFTVTNEGIGIPKEDQPHIFDMFRRGSNVNNIKGTGLGLAIVKQYVEAHKGTITFTSDPDEGTAFCVQIPIT